MQGRRRARTIAITFTALMLSVAVGVASMVGTSGERASVSDVAASRANPTQAAADDALFFADLRTERRERATWYAAVRGPTFEQVLVFFNVLSSTAPHEAPGRPGAPTTAPAPGAARPGGSATSSAPTTAPAPLPAASDVWTDAEFTQAVWDGVNARRAEAGLAGVSSEPRLTRAASDYAIVMSTSDWFSHTGPDGSSFVDRIFAAGFPFEGQVGEILAMGTNGWPAADVVQAWMDSPPHREQMLTPGYRRAGLDCAFTREDGALTVRCAMEFAE